MEGRARFLGHVPYDEGQEQSPSYDDDYNYDHIHDSIVKLPGRHYSKLPYSVPSRSPLSNSHTFDPHNKIRSSNDGWRDTQHYINEPKVSPVRTYSQQQYSQVHVNVNDDYFQNQNDEEHQRSYPKNNKELAGETKEQKNVIPEDITGPSFDRELPRNISVMEGRTAELVCGVVALGKKSVRPAHFLVIKRYDQ